MICQQNIYCMLHGNNDIYGNRKKKLSTDDNVSSVACTYMPELATGSADSLPDSSVMEQRHLIDIIKWH